MKIELAKIESKRLQTATNYAASKNIDRKYVYKLFKNETLDYYEIDGILFVYLNDKANKFKKTSNN